MSFNLIDAAKNLLPNDVISKAANSLGESESGIQKAISGSIPAVLSGLIGQSSGAGAAGILNMVKNAASSGILNNITGMLGGGGNASGIAGTVLGWLRSLFGDKLTSITNLIAGFAGIKPSSASSVLGLAAAPVIGSVGKYANENNLDASGLSSFLQSQKNFVANAIPPGLNLAGALGFANLGDIGNKISRGTTGAAEYAEDTIKRSGSKWLWILILLVAAILIWLLTSRGCNKEAAEDTVPADTTTRITTPAINTSTGSLTGRVDTVSGDYIYNTGDMIAIDLPNNGGQLNVGRFSTEARLVEFLRDNNAMIDTAKGNWFDFTNVRFKTGTAEISAESNTQLKNLVAIVKAFPNAKFKIGGYTDNTGDASANLSLSKNRAVKVADEIIRLGADKSQITGSDGYGDKFPVGDNSTPEGRAMNRRVSVNVKAK